MTKKSCLKKGLVMAGIIAAVLSLTGCPKEAEENGGSGFNIASIEGTWFCSTYPGTQPYHSASIEITSTSISLTEIYVTNYTEVTLSGEIVKTLHNNSFTGIIVKDSNDKFFTFYIKNIKDKKSIDVVHTKVNAKSDSLKEEEEVYYTYANSSLWQSYMGFLTYLYQ